ncbi:hypothetical protein [Desulfolucanica intricata]|uniref:hypothetical protein n=1 Tax=Desulfolucanica intricata TaxID=1285191 RepID=UPI00082979ED|nr:hypothetical protein [Desulfolucanica intricata]
MSGSIKEQKQSDKVKEKTPKNKLGLIVIVILLVCCFVALIAYGIHIHTPKHKFLKAISLEPTNINQAAISGNLAIVKYNFVAANERTTTKTINLNGSGISYNGEFDFNSKRMLLRISFNYNQKQYPIIVYMTDKQLILDAQGYIDMYQINVPDEEKIKVPQYIYTNKSDEMNIKQFWNKLENTLIKDKSSVNKIFEEKLFLIINSIPGEYFSKKDSGWLYLSFDRLGLQHIMKNVVKKTWDKDELLAHIISDLPSSNNEEGKSFTVQKQVNKEEALQNTGRIWNNIDSFIKLNKFSLGINNKATSFSNCFEINCSIVKNKDFPEGGEIILNGENKITVKKGVNIKIPVLNEQNSICLNDISL